MKSVYAITILALIAFNAYSPLASARSKLQVVLTDSSGRPVRTGFGELTAWNVGTDNNSLILSSYGTAYPEVEENQPRIVRQISLRCIVADTDSFSAFFAKIVVDYFLGASNSSDAVFTCYERVELQDRRLVRLNDSELEVSADAADKNSYSFSNSYSGPRLPTIPWIYSN